MLKIVILDAKVIGDDESLSAFKTLGEVRIFQTTTREQRIAHIADAEVIVTNKVLIDSDVFTNCKQLRLVCLTATGMNNVDLPLAKAAGVQVKNVAGYSTDSVAQCTFTMLFYLLGKPWYYDQYVKQGHYAQSDVFCHFGPRYWEIKNKRWGIIGLGSIGRRVATIAQAFGAEVVYYSTSGQNSTSDYQQLSLEELLKTSDIVSIHAPLNEHTKYLLRLPQLSQMKRNAILINVGRGSIVHEGDLAEALNSEYLAGAALDVLEKEPIEATNSLLYLKQPDRLYIAPHIAWLSHEALDLLIARTVENIKQFVINGY